MTTAYSAMVFVMLSVVFSTGCASLPSAPFPNVPQELEMVVITEREAGDCRNLAGSYFLAAEIISFSDDDWRMGYISESAIYSGLIGPAEAAGTTNYRLENVDSEINRAPNDKFFRIRFEGSTDLFMDYNVNKDRAINYFYFSSILNQFSCEKGLITFPVKVDLSGGEGVQANSQRLRVLGANKKET